MRRGIHLYGIVAGLSLSNVAALDLNPKLVGNWPGFRRDPGLVVRIEGESAYLLSYSDLHVLDISNPRSPVQIGGYDFRSDTHWSAANLWVTEKYAFVLGEDGLHVIDCANPAAPRRIGLTNSYVSDLVVLGTNAFLVDAIGLHVLDISNPANPQTVAAYNVTGESPAAVEVTGEYLLFSSLIQTPTDGYRVALRMFEIGNPSAPQLVGTYEVDGVRQFQAEIAVSGSHAYLLVDTLHIIEITDPANPQKIATYDVHPQPSAFTFRPRALALSPDSPHVYILTAYDLHEGTVILHRDIPHFQNLVESRVEIIDVSNPRAPTSAGTFSIGGAHQSVAAAKGVLYLAGAHPDLDVIDVSDPTAPREAAHTAIGDWALDVAIVGEYAYLAEGAAGLQVLDISQPENPRRVGHHPWRANRIVLSGRWAYLLGDDLQIVNIDNPATPKSAGRFAIDLPRALTIVGQHAYVITSPRFTVPNVISGELLIFDVIEPEIPQFVGRYVPESRPSQPENPLYAVAVSGNYAWLSERGTLSVIDIADPRNPRRVNEQLTDGVGYTELFCSGNFLYGLYRGEFQIMDIGNPLSPVLLSRYGFPGGPALTCAAVVWPEQWVGGLGLSISGDYAYVASGLGICSLEGTALNIVDISNPANPRAVGLLTRSFTTPNPFWRERTSRMALSGTHLFMADRNAGLRVINVAPANLKAARFDQIARDSAGPVRLRVSGPPLGSGRIQRSSDLRNWSDWLSVSFTESALEILDSDAASLASRFYRVVVP